MGHPPGKSHTPAGVAVDRRTAAKLPLFGAAAAGSCCEIARTAVAQPGVIAEKPGE
jgi:hypothetical protein